jgi:hypothetical protein
LVHCIRAAAEQRELVRAAERVREAQLLVLKGLRHFLMAPSAAEKISLRRLATVQDEMVAWERRSVEEIVGIYGKLTAGSREALGELGDDL